MTYDTLTMPLIPLLFSLLLGSIGAWFMSRYAYRFGLLDIPNDRSSHSLPTPRGGGIGILAAFIVSSAMLGLPLLTWLPATFLALVSFFDDKLGLSPRTRLVFQFAAAGAIGYGSWVIGHGFGVMGQGSGVMGYNLLPITYYLFSLVFIVGTANFYNFMDGINGIAGITGAVAFGLLGLFAQIYTGPPALALSAFCIAAACIGFLPFNMPRARVFMGDVGSILLGFVFAAFVVLLARSVADFLLLAGFLSTFYADALTTLWVRKREGERLSQAHRRHLYQLFANQKKVPHWKVSFSYGMIQAIVGTILICIRPFGAKAIITFEVLLLLGWWLVMANIRNSVELRAKRLI